MHLRHVDAGPRGSSDSGGLVAPFIRERKRKDRVGIMRPLGSDSPPHVAQDWITGAHSLREKRKPAQQQAVATSDKLADELRSSDIMLISTIIAAHGGSFSKDSPMASLNHLEPYLPTIFRFVNAEFPDAQEETRDRALAGRVRGHPG